MNEAARTLLEDLISLSSMLVTAVKRPVANLLGGYNDRIMGAR